MRNLLLFLILLSSPAFAQNYLEIVNPPEGNHKIKNFAAAKRVLKNTHYLGARKTFYCNCPMTAWNRFSNLGCNYVNKKYDKQWQNVEAEHLVPLSKILEGTKAYQVGDAQCKKGEKGRSCVDKVYGFVAGDLWILAPAELELNRVHSNYQWAELGGQGEQWGSCDFFYADKKVQPPKHLKGTIARAYQYIEKVYKVKVISGKNEKLFALWADYAPTQDQCDRAKGIVREQGNKNEFEISACKKANLW